MTIDALNHFTVLTKDLDATRNFYVGILGLKEGYRPPLGFPGTWLYAGAQPVLHVVAGRPLPRFYRVIRLFAPVEGMAAGAAFGKPSPPARRWLEVVLQAALRPLLRTPVNSA